jgi:hypothetical protein
MQLTPETAAEVHQVFDDPEPTVSADSDDLDETRFVDQERYGSRAPRLAEVHDTSDFDADTDVYERL